MLIAIIVIAIIIGYAGLIGLIQPRVEKSLISSCKLKHTDRPNLGYYQRNAHGYCGKSHADIAWVIAVLWPIMGPMFLTRYHSVTTGPEHKQAKELAAAEHRTKLAEAQADEAEAIDRQLRAARR